MIPIKFKESNCQFGPPKDLDPSQCMTVSAFQGEVKNPNSSMDGCPVVVVAWKPSLTDIELLKEGQPIYLSMIGGLPPHFLSMSFEAATNPA